MQLATFDLLNVFDVLNVFDLFDLFVRSIILCRSISVGKGRLYSFGVFREAKLLSAEELIDPEVGPKRSSSAQLSTVINRGYRGKESNSGIRSS